jgi:hypothetical protein
MIKHKKSAHQNIDKMTKNIFDNLISIAHPTKYQIINKYTMMHILVIYVSIGVKKNNITNNF